MTGKPRRDGGDRAPALDHLAACGHAGWLWDADALRIAWANGPGLRFWNAESLFDLLDRRFDAHEPGVAEIARIARDAAGDEAVEADLAFPSSGRPAPLRCRCWRHALADGRAGLLVVAADETHPRGPLSADLATAVIERIPIPLAVFDESGALQLRNAAAKALFDGRDDGSGETMRSHATMLADVLCEAGAAPRLIALAVEAGLVSETMPVRTAIGERSHRVTACRLGDGEDADAAVVILFDDVTERRRHERALVVNARRLEELVAAAADFTFELDEGLAVRALSEGFEAVTGAEPAAIVGCDWPDLAHEAAPSVRAELARALEAHEDFHVTLGWGEGPRAPRLAWSAVALTDAGGRFAGYRGVAARVGETKTGGEAAAVAGSAREAGPAGDQRAGAHLDETDRDVFDAIARTIRTEMGEGEAEAPAEANAAADAQAAQASLRQVLDSALVGVVVHRDFDILYANPAAAEALGLKTPAALEKQASVLALFPDEETALRKADKACAGDGAAPAALTLTAGRGKAARRLGARMAPIAWPDGEARQLLLAPAVTAGTAGEAEELRAILDTATDGILTLDARGRIESANAGAASIFGFEQSKLEGRPLAELMDKASAKVVRDYIKSVSAAGIESLLNDGREVTAVEKKGGEIPLFLSIGRIDSGKRKSRARYCAVIRDLTQWKKTEGELRRAKEEAEQASAQKTEFLANVSHELRTPLNAIIGFSEVMNSERFGPLGSDRYKAYVNDIFASAEHVLSLINDLLDLSKVEAGRLELDFAGVRLGDIVQQCVSIMQPQANRAQVIIRSSLAEDLPAVMADQRSMRQIMLNLLSNAVKYTDAGGQVIVSAFLRETGEVAIRVRDTGIGMSEQELAHALEPFRRIERAGRETLPGTGIGLPLAKALAEANRAEFSIESTPERGTSVQVIFPAARVLAE